MSSQPRPHEYNLNSEMAGHVHNMLRTGVFLIFLCIVSTAGAVDLASPAVFDPYFYINTNVEVLQAGIRDVTSARHHWLQHGISMGLQGSGNFHSKQYLARYHDLSEAFGNNYQQAIVHYLTNGIQEHRLGYLEGGFEGRWTVSDTTHQLHVSASRRMAASIDSVVWNNKEFINAWDHGRELQMAMNFPPNGECFNPTEAGGLYDFQTNSTHSHIQLVQAHSNQLHTKVLPAFWIEPGEHQHRINQEANCQKGDPALNKVYTYLHPFSKTVTLHCPGIHTPCLTFNGSFTIAGDIPNYHVIQMTVPAGYAPRDFTKHLFLDPTTGHFTSTQKTNTAPIVAATPDNRYAIGAYAPSGQDTSHLYYGGPRLFPGSNAASDTTNYWAVVFQHHPFPPRSTHVQSYYSYVCIGTLQDVIHCITTLRKSQDPGLIG